MRLISLMRRKQHFAEEEWTDPRPAEVRVEDRHLRRQNQGGQKVMHEVGAERRPAGKPAGQGGRPVQGQRPAGQQARPVTQEPDRQQPQAEDHTAGTRPAAPQTGRPAPQEPDLQHPRPEDPHRK